MENKQKIVNGLILILTSILFGFAFRATKPLENNVPNSIIQSSDIKLVSNYIANREGIPEDNVLLISQHIRDYPILNRKFLCTKVLDKKTNKIFDGMLDLSTKSFTSLEDIEKQYSDAFTLKYGKLEPQLYELLQSTVSEKNIDVALWFTPNDKQSKALEKVIVNYPNLPKNAIERPWVMVNNGDVADVIQNNYLNYLKQENLTQQGRLGEWLSQQGFNVKYHPGIPSLVTSIPKQMIIQAALRTDVERIYLIGGKLDMLLNIAVPTTKTNFVWDLGFTGSGVRVAVLEEDTIPYGHPSINVIAVRNSNPNNQHATQVASAIASHNPTYRGMAPEASIVSAGFTISNNNYDDVDDAIVWAHDVYNTHIMNASFTTEAGEQTDEMQWIDRVFDYYARNYNITMIAAAGNQRYGNHIGSPAKGYNVLAVGGTDDRRTVAWDDQMTTFSAWKNPKRSDGVYGDREKPEVVASALNLTVLNNDNSTAIQSGTSYSAPLVTGLAALLANRNSQLYDAPEAMRAIIMASAWNNIEGPVGIPTGQDLKDGAGAIDALSADETAITGHNDVYQYPYPVCQSPCWWWNYVYNSSNDPQTNFPVGTYRFYAIKADKGERIRVALSWVSTPSGPGSNYAMDPLETDLDLVIFDPNWDFAPNGVSASFDNSYELVDFIAEKSGTYQIGVYKKSGDYLNYIGLAWSRKYQTFIPTVIVPSVGGLAKALSPYPAPAEIDMPSKESLSPYPVP
jgi:subtilisin family serine protease